MMKYLLTIAAGLLSLIAAGSSWLTQDAAARPVSPVTEASAAVKSLRSTSNIFVEGAPSLYRDIDQEAGVVCYSAREVGLHCLSGSQVNLNVTSTHEQGAPSLYRTLDKETKAVCYSSRNAPGLYCLPLSHTKLSQKGG
jgi:hypothetical protein